LLNWTYQGRELTAEEISDYAGFVYIIENLETGRKYIGKKTLKFSRRKKVKGKMRRVVVESDFRRYFGSNDELNADVKALGEDRFTRTVLRFCKTKSEMTYCELHEQMSRHVLLDDSYYNTWILARVRRSAALGNLKGFNNDESNLP
jgi:hypothetical protein